MTTRHVYARGQQSNRLTIFKTLSARIRGAKTELSDLGVEEGEFTETTSQLRDLVKSLTGFDIQKDENTYKDIYDILLGIGKEWKNLTDLEQASLAEKLAGKRGANTLFAVLNNVEGLEAAYATAQGAAGSAAREQENYAQSVQYSIDRAKASLQELAVNFLSSDLLKGLIEAANQLLQIVNDIVGSIGSVPSIITSLVGIDLAKGALGNQGVLASIFSGVAATKGVATNNFGANLAAAFKKPVAETAKDVATEGVKVATETVTEEMGPSVAEVLAGAAPAVAEGAKGAGEAIGNAVNEGANGALKAGAAGLSASAIAGLTALAAAASIAIYAYFKERHDKMIEDARAAGEEWTKTQSSLSDLASQYESLRTKLDHEALTEEERIATKQQIYDIQKQITEQYGYQNDSLDLINGRLKDQLALFNDIKQKQADQLLLDNYDEYNTLRKDMTKDREYTVDRYEVNDTDLQKIIDRQFRELGIQERYDQRGNIDYVFSGNYQEIASDVAALTARLEEQKDAFKADSREAKQLQKVIDRVRKATSAATKFVSENAESYQRYLSLEFAKRGGVEIGDQFEGAIEWLNNAFLSGDTTQIQEALSTYQQTENALSEFVKNNAESLQGFDYVQYFDQLREGINSAAAEVYAFETALRGEGMGLSLTEMLLGANGAIDVEQTAQIRERMGEIIAVMGEELSSMELDEVDIERLLDNKNIGAKTNKALKIIKPLQDAFGGIWDESATGQANKTNFINALTRSGRVAMSTASQVEVASANMAASFKTSSESAKTFGSTMSTLESLISGVTTGVSLSAETIESLFSDDSDLKDYAAAIEFVNGTYQLNAEKVREIAAAKGEEAIATNEANKVAAQNEYLENSKKIQELNNAIALNISLNGRSREEMLADVQTLEARNDEIVNTCNGYDAMNQSIREATGAYQAWKASQNASTSGDMFSDALSALEVIQKTFDPESDTYMLWGEGNTHYQGALDLLVPEEVAEKGHEAVKEYYDAMSYMFTKDEEGLYKDFNPIGFLDKAVERGLMSYDPNTDKYELIGAQTMQDFADGMDLVLPVVQAAFGKLNMYEGVSFNWASDAVDTFGDLAIKAEQAKDVLGGMWTKTQAIRIDYSDIEGLDNKLKVINQDIVTATRYRATLEVDSDEWNAAGDLIAYYINQKNILQQPLVLSLNRDELTETQADVVSMIDELQSRLSQKELLLTLDPEADTSKVEENINAAWQNILEHSSEISSTLGIDFGELYDSDSLDIDSFLSKLQEQTPEVLLDLGFTPESLEAAKTIAEDVSPGLDEDSLEGLEQEFSNLIALKESLTSSASISITTSITGLSYVQRELDNFFERNKNRVIQVGVQPATSLSSQPSGRGQTTQYSLSGSRKHKLNGTAHASGTAKAHGDWGAESNQRVLIGELGPEIVVDPHTGKWRTYGDNGAEFAYIPKDAIVFNHKQTEGLLQRGFVNSRATARNGSAFVSGTAKASSSSMYMDYDWYMSTGNYVAAQKAYDAAAKAAVAEKKAAEARAKAAAASTNAATSRSMGASGSALRRNLSGGYSSSGSGSSGGSGGGGGGGGSSAAEKAQEEIKDWVEVLLQRIARLFENFKNMSEYWATYNNQLRELNSAIAQARTNIEKNKAAYKRYIQEANSVGLSEAYMSKVRNGELDIETITDEDLKNKIDQYTEW